MQLTLNGCVIGTKRLADAVDGVLTWTIPYEPGTLKAVGLNKGTQVSEFALQTAGGAKHIELLPDTTQLQSNGKDVCHVEFRIVDAYSVRVPGAATDVKFTLTGPAVVLGIGNGDLDDTEDNKVLTHKMYEGRGLAILQSTPSPGAITLTATAPGLAPAIMALNSR